MKRIPLLLGLGLSLLASSCSGSDADAEQVLEEVLDVYATCSSYQDKGQVESVFIHPDLQERTVVKPFETAFVRETGAFRFEFRNRSTRDEVRRYVVWRDGSDAKSWWTVKPEVREWESISRGLAAATGVSGSSASRIPSLLMDLGWKPNPPPQWTFLATLVEPRWVGLEPVDGVECVRIDALERSDGSSCSLWIDDRRLIRKWYSLRDIQPADGAPFVVRTTITWNPKLNEEVRASALGFEPPADK